MDTNAYQEARSIEDRKRSEDTEKIRKLEQAFKSQSAQPRHVELPTFGSSTAASHTDRLLSEPPHGDHSDRELTPISTAATEIEAGRSVIKSWVENSESDALRNQFNAMEQFMTSLRGTFEQEINDRDNKLEVTNKMLAEAKDSAKRLEEELRGAMSKSARLEVNLDELKKTLADKEELLRNAEAKRAKPERDEKSTVTEMMLRQFRLLTEKLEEELHANASQSAALELDLDATKKALAEKNEELQRVESKRVQAEDEIEDLASKMQLLGGSLMRSKSSRGMMESELDTAQREIESLEADLAAYKKRNADLEHQVKTYKSVLDSSSHGSSTLLDLQQSEGKRLEAERRLSEVEHDLALCTTKLNMIVCSVTMGKLETKSELMARAPSNPEGLNMVMKGSNHEVLQRVPMDEKNERYRAYTPFKSPNVTRHKWVDPVD